MSQESSLPPIGTKAVHKSDYEKLQGPVYEVTGHQKHPEKPTMISLEGAKHKLNTAPVTPKSVTPGDFRESYRTL